MFGYFVTRPVVLELNGQRKYLQAVQNVEAPKADQVYLAAQYEVELVKTALNKRYGQAMDVNDVLRVVQPEAMRDLPGVPPLVGVGALPHPQQQTGPHVLRDQLRELRSKAAENSQVTSSSARRHYRLLLLNGFGTNLGDTLMGLTAWREVFKVLQAEWGSVSVDVLLGWQKTEAIESLLRTAPGVDRILTQGPSVSELGRYTAAFDFAGMINQPRFGQMPMVDWYLWWMGLNPSDVPAPAKRNAVTLTTQATQAIEQALAPIAGPKVLFNPKASVELRSMPEATALAWVQHVLRSWPDWHVALIHPMQLDHPRVLNMCKAIDDVDKLAALVARVDAVIGVDTFTQHLADATDTPVLTVYTSFAPTIYPYYPLAEALLLPGCQDLPAWGKPKVKTQEWKTIATAYEAAWQQLPPQLVLDTLQRSMERKAQNHKVRDTGQNPYSPAVRRKTVLLDNAEVQIPVHQRDDAWSTMQQQLMLRLARQELCRGDTVALLGAAAGEVAIGLASMVGHHGKLVAFEPRRELHQQLCANLVRLDIGHAQAHAVLPVAGALALRDVFHLYSGDDYSPLMRSNSTQLEAVISWPLDTLKLENCRLLLVSAPMPLVECLQGAANTLERLRPVVIVGLASRPEELSIRQFFGKLNYQVQTLDIGNTQNKDKTPQLGMLVAHPNLQQSSGTASQFNK